MKKWRTKGAAMAASESRGVRLRITAYSQNLRECESGNQTSRIRNEITFWGSAQ